LILASKSVVTGAPENGFLGIANVVKVVVQSLLDIL